MPAVKSSRVFRCDYTNKDVVVNLAKEFGKGMTVTKHDSRTNYNITHTSRRDLWDIPGVIVICHT